MVASLEMHLCTDYISCLCLTLFPSLLFLGIKLPEERIACKLLPQTLGSGYLGSIAGSLDALLIFSSAFTRIVYLAWLDSNCQQLHFFPWFSFLFLVRAGERGLEGIVGRISQSWFYNCSWQAGSAGASLKQWLTKLLLNIWDPLPLFPGITLSQHAFYVAPDFPVKGSWVALSGNFHDNATCIDCFFFHLSTPLFYQCVMVTK